MIRVPAALALIVAGATAPAARADDETFQRIDAFGGFMIADSRNLPGQTEGTSAALGYGVGGGVRSARGRSVFAADFHVVEGLTFSPLTSSFFKSLDDARLRSSYSFRITPWLDFTAWAHASAPLFASWVHLPQTTTFVVQRADGLVERERAPSFELSQPFLPLQASETVGLGAHALTMPFLVIDVRAGIGAAHAVADGQLALRDDPETVDVEVVELESHHALVPVVEVALSGEIEDRLAYGLDVGVRMPVLHTENVLVGDRSPPELTTVHLRLDLSLQILPWLTTDYELLVQRDPFLSAEVGVGNRLILAAHPFARDVKAAP